ncbi:FAD-dependent oxidoreductase [Aeromicrobium fastidiosum]|uniref:ferredoxin--NADP(+) reductase n=1 Tax=Aeromicrobium fastidiosum TaxID=52699 RepID=A0A641AU91_9ACTN|nr:FAD-dependent oxidoreductase [Aeromicrobium fastidiosum]KAA1380581.1 NAD(P)-binding protein [Aeromicrobium fastidiosum]MBP2390179.1 ferredoxin--NADP+ reductase [Aeromicrobium fastidiosum]
MSAGPHVAIIGSGPAGCYTAQALRKDWPDAEITVIDRLPVPYGLIRYGVAADHQGTKAVTKQFDRLFERAGVTFSGGVEVGLDVTLEQLADQHDAVVLATGCDRDRELAIAGSDLPEVYPSGPLTALLNGHPDSSTLVPRLGENVVVVGNGNVAVDVVRLLAKHPDDFAGSDLPLAIHDLVHRPGVLEVTVVGRGPAETSRFDATMIKELGQLEGVRFVVEDVNADRESEVPQIAALAHLLEHQVGGDRVQVTFRFGWQPESIGGDSHVEAISFISPDGRVLRLPTDSVVSAIGFDASAPLVRDAGGDLTTDGRLAPGLYCVGWARTGPRGAIPDARADARLVASAITADLRAAPCKGEHDPAALRATWPAVDFAAWQRIDDHERATASSGRVRNKILDHAELRRVAATTSLTSEGEQP